VLAAAVRPLGGGAFAARSIERREPRRNEEERKELRATRRKTLLGDELPDGAGRVSQRLCDGQDLLVEVHPVHVPDETELAGGHARESTHDVLPRRIRGEAAPDRR